MTSTEVARRAGVSQSAVSLVFSGKASGRVSKRTEQVIWKVARELGYRPNLAAQTLRLGRSRRLVLAVPDIDNPYFAGTLKGAEREARRHGYSTALAQVQEPQDWQTVILDALVSGSVDGFALFALRPPASRAMRRLRGRTVLVDAVSGGFPSISLDIEGGMRSAMLHLLELGHTRIAHLAADIDAETFSIRKNAYLNTMHGAGLTTRADWQIKAPFGIAGASIATQQVLAGPDAPSAIVCDSDVLAAGVYKAAKAVQFRIPEDLSVVGIDDSLIARVLDPSLTTVAIPSALVGEQAVRLLVDQLGGVEKLLSPPIPLSLVVRQSTAPLRQINLCSQTIRSS
ncbi:MAG: LacI family DNA-binding transcriptional regulator [Candidatus Acidiferrum sp.]|jgi:DNA-binding LacI/PurR family transcriptional regulator